MLISDQIAELLEAMLTERDGILEIRRNEMAERLLNSRWKWVGL